MMAMTQASTTTAAASPAATTTTEAAATTTAAASPASSTATQQGGGGAQGAVQISSDWWMAFQEGTGFPYYYNATTKELTWNPPMFGVGGDGKQVQMGGGGGAGATMGSASGLGQREVEVRGSGNIPKPLYTFDMTAQYFPQEIRTPLLKAGFATPTSIQSHCWPIAVTGRDIIGVAKTGSGKTLAFLLPCFAKILQNPRAYGWPAIVTLAPTRELACQIEVEAQKFGA